MARVTLADIKKYLEDFEAGLASWWHDQDARLDRIENRLAGIEAHLATKVPADEGEPGPDSQDLPIDPEFVAERLGLTRGEGRVATMLAAGLSVEEIAAATGNKESTVRWFLRQINGKLKIRRQTQLVGMVLRLPTNCHAEKPAPDATPPEP